MSELNADLLVLEASSMTSGFRILNSIPDQDSSSVQVIDAEPIGGGRFLILAKGAAQDLVGIERAVGGDLASYAHISKISTDVLDAIYSLASVKFEAALLVVETKTASALLSVAQTLVTNHGLKAIEIRIRKSGLAGGFAYFTGSKEQCSTGAEAARAFATVELIDQPSKAVRALFETV